MREVLKSQMKFGEVAIADIEFDIRSRDEIPKLLIGLQAIHDKLDSCSSDKGFHSPENKEKLRELLYLVVLPRPPSRSRLYNDIPDCKRTVGNRRRFNLSRVGFLV